MLINRQMAINDVKAHDRGNYIPRLYMVDKQVRSKARTVEMYIIYPIAK